MPENIPSRGGCTEALILGNGPSLLGRDWAAVPWGGVYIIGCNQSWRVVPDADAHVAVDGDQYSIKEGQPYYREMATRGTLFHCGSGGSLGRQLDRHDQLTFSRHPFRKRHRGAGHPVPDINDDGGVTLKVGHESGGSTCYIALQIAVGMGFERIWFVGLDCSDKKFTGTKSNSEKHDRLWCKVPADVRNMVRVIGPSNTQQFDVVGWPWVSKEAAA